MKTSICEYIGSLSASNPLFLEDLDRYKSDLILPERASAEEVFDKLCSSKYCTRDVAFVATIVIESYIA